MNLVRLFSLFLFLNTVPSTFADTGLFRLQGSIFFTSDILAIKAAFSSLKKCDVKPIYVETLLGKSLGSIAAESDAKALPLFITYQKTHYHAVINSSPEMGIAAKKQYDKCFKAITNETNALALSEYYLKQIVREKSKISELPTELDKLYSHELLNSTSTKAIWKKK